MGEEESLEERVGKIVEEELADMDDIVKEIIREKKEEIIEEKVREELAKEIFQNTSSEGGSLAS